MQRKEKTIKGTTLKRCIVIVLCVLGLYLLQIIIAHIFLPGAIMKDINAKTETQNNEKYMHIICVNTPLATGDIVRKKIVTRRSIERSNNTTNLVPYGKLERIIGSEVIIPLQRMEVITWQHIKLRK